MALEPSRLLGEEQKNPNGSGGKDWNGLFRGEQVSQKQKSINSSSSEAIKRDFNFSMKWLLCFVLKRPCLCWAATSAVHLALSQRLIRVFSRSWDRVTKTRMYLIISMKAVFILISCIGGLALRPSLCKACRHGNSLMFYLLPAGLEPCRGWKWICRERKAIDSLPWRTSLLRYASSSLSLRKWEHQTIALIPFSLP